MARICDVFFLGDALESGTGLNPAIMFSSSDTALNWTCQRAQALPLELTRGLFRVYTEYTVINPSRRIVCEIVANTMLTNAWLHLLVRCASTTSPRRNKAICLDGLFAWWLLLPLVWCWLSKRRMLWFITICGSLRPGINASRLLLKGRTVKLLWRWHAWTTILT